MNMNQAMLHISTSQDVRRENPLDRGLSPGQSTPFHLRWFGFQGSVPPCRFGRDLLVAGLLVLVLLTPAAAFPFINKEGQRVDITARLPKDQQTVVFFHAPWSKTSSRYQVELSDWEKKQDKVAILGVQLKSLDAPVARQYSVTSVPWFLVYNQKGELTSSGQAALTEVLKMMKESSRR
jgi:hypothetical protein